MRTCSPRVALISADGHVRPCRPVWPRVGDEDARRRPKSEDVRLEPDFEVPLVTGRPRGGGGLATLLLSAALISACTGREVTVTDFSRTIQLVPEAPDSQIVGLLLHTDLDATSEVVLDIGCGGTVQTQLTISPNRKSDHRIDWYSACAEISFSQGAAHARSMKLSYRFLKL